MKQLINKVLKGIKSVKGNSLAEFATTTALMATLAATAAPKLSEMSEGAKGEKSRNEIDKIVKQAGQFYQDTAESEGRGRFPNQEKFNVSIGGASAIGYSNGGTAKGTYSLKDDTTASNAHTDLVLKDLGIHATQDSVTQGWDRFDEVHSNYWQMVFGEARDDVYMVSDAENHRNEGEENEWNSLFGDEVLESKFQDGEYVYTVVAGGGTGTDVYPPTIYVGDVESVVDFHNLMMP